MAEFDFFRKNKKYAKLSLVILVFLLGVFSDRVASYFFVPTTFPFPAPVRQKGYTYVSPLLYCRYPNAANSQLISKIHNELEEYITDENSKGITQNVSVYFHDPTTGEWTSVNGTEQYALASLIKVPLLMMIYKQAETNPSLLASKLSYTGSNDNNIENFKPTGQQEMQQGESYTVDDLATRMIIYSDNNAMNILTSKIQLNDFNDDLEQLNVSPIQGNSQQDISMTVGKYATFFRILYNATYLDPMMSEKALKLLTKTTFTEGIVGGVSKNIQVAHKFGERAYGSSMTKELHDCGIVYYPNHPYILCVMTKGYDFENLESVIQTISQKTYNAVKDAYQ